VRCGRCGNDNVETNRFCGMCGAALVPKGQPPGPSAWPVAPVNTAPTRQAAVPVSKPISQTSQVGLENGDAGSREQRSPSVVSSHSEPARAPAISGPSFLGLQSSRTNLDYLLDDEDEPRRGGKLILFVLALGLAVGFGYMHWKKGGFDWLNLGPRRAPVTSPASDGNQTSSDAGVPPGTVAPQNPASTSAPAASAPAAPVPTDGPATNSADPAAANGSPQTSSPAAQPTASPSQAAAPQATSSPAPADSRAAPDTPQGSSTPDSENSASGQQSADEEQSAEPEKPAPRKSAAAKPAAAKPSPARAIGAKPSDSVAEAERYIYGRGVAQDCDHGLRLLKPSAQSNPNAMISLGALYSTGTCTPRDLPTAYRWFALALHQQPDNQVLQNDLQKLWSQMTQPERQLAIKLSQ